MLERIREEFARAEYLEGAAFDKLERVLETKDDAAIREAILDFRFYRSHLLLFSGLILARRELSLEIDVDDVDDVRQYFIDRKSEFERALSESDDEREKSRLRSLISVCRGEIMHL